MVIGIEECDAVIFDIDGVLVDVRRSYDKAIIKTVEIILKDSYDIEIANEFPFEKLISNLRNTGGFNNDIDTAYAIILIILHCILINKMNIQQTLVLFDKIIEGLDDKGTNSVEKELEKTGNMRALINELGYPSNEGKDKNENLISTRFNEIFYGPDLFKRQFNREPRYYIEQPLIRNDILIIKEESIKKLSQRFDGNLGLISGRSKVASYFTLGDLIKYFKEAACIFLEDEKREFSKPNPFSLHKVLDNLRVKSALYVGDSVADLLMVKNFNSQVKNKRVYFCGVYGEGSKNSHSVDSNVNTDNKINGNNLYKIKKEILKSKKADLIIENVNDLPNILNITKN